MEIDTEIVSDLVRLAGAGPELTWSIAPGADVAALTEAISGTWKAYVDEANK